MNVFIGMKVPREDQSLRRAADLLFAAVRSAGHQPFVATDEIARRQLKDSNDFMPFVRDALRDMDLVIVLHHAELRGGLIEAGIAYAWDIPIWLCRRPDERVSSSMRGCADVIVEYDDLDDLHDKLFNKLTKESIAQRALWNKGPR